MRRENEVVESYKNLAESRSQLAQKEINAVNEKSAEIERFKTNYYTRRDMRNRKEASRAALMEAARNEAFGTVIKAIYIGALEASTLTDDGIILAESMVENWIKENGGASAILSKVGNKTYLLSRITQIVEDAAEADVKEIEAEEPIEGSDDEKENSGSKKKDAAIAAAAEFLKTARKKDVHDFMSQIFTAAKEEEDRKSEEAAEKREEKKAAEEEADNEGKEEVELQLPKSDEKPEEGEENKEDGEAAPEEPAGEEGEQEVEDEDPLKDTTFEDDPEDDNKDDDSDDDDEEDDDKDDDDDSDDDDEKKDDNDNEPSKEDVEDHVDDELGEPLDDDGIDQDTTIDGHTGNDGKIFDELNKEEDVQKAVEIIRSRIADAEETFIRNNAEDKKKIDELLNKISNNVKTIEDLDGKDDTKTKIAEESVRVYKRHIDSIKEHRNMTVFEKMSRNLSKNIIKDEVVRENYITESGTLDTDLIVEASKVMYGFLETINTLQLDKVDSAYIKKVLDGMN